LQSAQGTFTNKIREREKKEDRLKDDCEVRADLSLNWEEKRKNENEIMASRSYQVLSLPSIPL